MLSVVPVTTQPAASVTAPAVTDKVVPASKVPLAASVVAPPLRARLPAPVTKELEVSTWLPPVRASVALGALLKVPE